MPKKRLHNTLKLTIPYGAKQRSLLSPSLICRVRLESTSLYTNIATPVTTCCAIYLHQIHFNSDTCTLPLLQRTTIIRNCSKSRSLPSSNATHKNSVFKQENNSQTQWQSNGWKCVHCLITFSTTHAPIAAELRIFRWMRQQTGYNNFKM